MNLNVGYPASRRQTFSSTVFQLLLSPNRGHFKIGRFGWAECSSARYAEPGNITFAISSRAFDENISKNPHILRSFGRGLSTTRLEDVVDTPNGLLELRNTDSSSTFNGQRYTPKTVYTAATSAALRLDKLTHNTTTFLLATDSEH
jgi:hypothetical protein